MAGKALRHLNRWTSLVVVLALALLANYFGGKYWTSLDWSAARFYSLSAPTLERLEVLDDEVRLVSLLSPATGQVEARVFEELRATLLAFTRARPGLVTLEERDPLRDPAFAQAMLESPGTALERPLNVIVVEMKGRSHEIALDDMVELDASQALYGPAPVKALTLEGELLEALVALSRDERPLVRFATGHGEVNPDDGPGPASYAAFVEALASRDIQVDTWEALGAEGAEVPADTDLVVVAAPALAWEETESAALAAYLERGGRLLLLVEPLPAEDGSRMARLGLEDLLERYGVRLGDALVLDPGSPILDFGAEVFYAFVRPGHPIGDALAEQALIFNLARPLIAAEEPGEGIRAHALLESSREAWGETNLASLSVGATREGSDEPAPLTLALALEALSVDASTRLVVLGDASLATDETFSVYAHRPFLLGAVGWLLEDEPSLGLEPKDRNLTQLFLDAGEQRHLALLVTLALPGFFVALGLATWWRRRKA